MLQATLTSREDNSVVFQITVPASQVNTALNRVYQQIAGSQRVNGFRRGKAPREVLNTIFGIESIHSQALQDLLPDAFYEAAAQLNLSPIGAPDFDPFPVIEEGKDMEINVKVDVLPDIHLADYASVNIDMEKEVSVENDELEDALL